MAPPFVLEPFIPPAGTCRNPTEIVAKNSYCTKVKTENWQYRYKWPSPNSQEDLKSCPPENSPDSECICDSYKSTYKLMTEQLHSKDTYVDPNPHRDMFNYYAYRDKMINTDKFNIRRNFPTIMKNDSNIVPEYMTTMQMSYSQPLGIIMQRLRAPQERYMLHRRMKGTNDATINTKFLDDRDTIINKQYKCAKGGGRGHSYNFMTGINTDGSLPRELNMKQDQEMKQSNKKT